MQTLKNITQCRKQAEQPQRQELQRTSKNHASNVSHPSAIKHRGAAASRQASSICVLFNVSTAKLMCYCPLTTTHFLTGRLLSLVAHASWLKAQASGSWLKAHGQVKKHGAKGPRPKYGARRPGPGERRGNLCFLGNDPGDLRREP